MLRAVVGWRCALSAGALGAGAPLEQRLSLEAPSSSGSQLARANAAAEAAAAYGAQPGHGRRWSQPEAASARRVLRVVVGQRCALGAGALGAGAPLEQRLSLESPSSSESQLARASAAAEAAQRAARGVVAVGVDLSTRPRRPAACCASSSASAARSARERSARARRLSNGCHPRRRRRRGRSSRGRVRLQRRRGVRRVSWSRSAFVSARGNIGPPRAARRCRPALRVRRGSARRGCHIMVPCHCGFSQCAVPSCTVPFPMAPPYVGRGVIFLLKLFFTHDSRYAPWLAHTGREYHTALWRPTSCCVTVRLSTGYAPVTFRS